MARIKIADLPRDMKISKEELKRIRGGAFDAFLKIEGISGEAQDKDHKGWSDLLSYSWSLSQPSSGAIIGDTGGTQLR